MLNSSILCANSWIRTNNLLKTYVSIFWRDKFSLSSQGEQWVLCPVELYSLTHFINRLCFKMDSNHHSTFFKYPTLEYCSDSNRESDHHLCVYLCAIEASILQCCFHYDNVTFQLFTWPGMNNPSFRISWLITP